MPKTSQPICWWQRDVSNWDSVTPAPKPFLPSCSDGGREGTPADFNQETRGKARQGRDCGGGGPPHPPLLAHCPLHPPPALQPRLGCSRPGRPPSSLSPLQTRRPHTSQAPHVVPDHGALQDHHAAHPLTPSCLQLPAAHPAMREPQSPAQAPGPAQIWSPICLPVRAPPAPAPHSSH